MRKEILRKVNGIRKIGEDFFIQEENSSSAISTEKFIPVYFPITYATKIHHDSPVIGAYELGETENSIHGPFLSEQDSNEAIQNASKSISHVSYEFSSKIVIKLLSPDKVPEDNPPETFRYYRNSFSLASTSYSEELEFVLRPHLAPSPEKVIRFSRTLERRLNNYASKIKQVDKSIIAIVNNKRPFFCELTPATEENSWIRYSTFSEKPTPESFDPELEELGISPRAPELSSAHEYLSLFPVEISISHNSIEDLVRSNRLIS